MNDGSIFDESPELSQWYASTFGAELSLFAAPKPRSREAALVHRVRCIDQVSALVDALRPTPARFWQPDAASSACPLCQRPFTLLHRRHHCRVCLQLRCDDCAPDAPPRLCYICARKAMLYELLLKVRSAERQAWQLPTRQGVMTVAKAYREAIEAFAASDYESGVLLRGLRSFLDLDEIRALLPAESAPPSPQAAD